ncbi:Putative O-phosphotransferase [Vibrio marisflavi CECT 7928]|uniref:O-phosphotransferase n=1 Tax=Vibrio marisflavi CECT 7928 TaxID=634439 RepID=A0ABM8ZZU2_9VIBR|nr:Putative O-phosphotransferase [Vibrio marisflavi CECT 7928]
MDIIFLNGASSSGKSSIAKQLQMILGENYLHLGIDTFISIMPERCNRLTDTDVVAEGFYWVTQNLNGKQELRIQSGDYGKRVNHAYRTTVKHFADLGLRVIVDDVMDGRLEQRL